MDHLTGLFKGTVDAASLDRHEVGSEGTGQVVERITIVGQGDQYKGVG